MSAIEDLKEQLRYLRELGVDALAAESFMASAHARHSAAAPPAKDPQPFIAVPPPDGLLKKKDDVVPAAAGPTDRSKLVTQLPKLSNLMSRKSQPAERPPSQTMIEKPAETAMPLAETSGPNYPENDSIEQIRIDIGPDCVRCTLCQQRTQVVNSVGNFNAELMFIGEAPGADEDRQGVPFVGRAGQLLTKIIESIGFSRDEVFIGNINRCRPPGNRPPERVEADACRPFLLREIAVVKPKVIVVLGTTAAHNLLQIKTPISKLRGNFHDYFGVKVMPTFHPAYLLRDPNKKREVWEDMKKVRDLLAANTTN